MSRAGVPASVSGFGGVASTFIDQIEQIRSSLGLFNNAVSTISAAFNPLQQQAAAAATQLGQFGAFAGAVGPQVQQQLVTASGYVQSGLATLFAGAQTYVTGPLSAFGSAVTSQIEAIGQVINQSRAFVEALNPAVVMQFDYVMRNLQATIGTALVPIFTVFTDIISQVSGQILPVMQQLTPIIKLLSETIGGILVTEIKILVQVFDILKPIIDTLVTVFVVIETVLKVLFTALMVLLAPLQILAKVISYIIDPFLQLFNALSGVINDFMTVIQVFIKTFIDILSSMFGSSRGAFNGLVDAVRQAIRAFVEFSARIGILFFGNDFIQRLLANFSPRGATAAPQGVGISSFADIARRLNETAFIAGGGQQDTTESLLRDIREDLSGLANLSSQQIWDDFADKIGKAVARALNPVPAVLDTISGVASGLWNFDLVSRVSGA